MRQSELLHYMVRTATCRRPRETCCAGVQYCSFGNESKLMRNCVRHHRMDTIMRRRSRRECRCLCLHASAALSRPVYCWHCPHPLSRQRAGALRAACF